MVKQITIRLPSDLHNEVKQQAQKDDRSFNTEALARFGL